MAYEPQPGTIPHRAVVWLRAMNELYAGRWYSTPDLCSGLDVEVTGFSAYMAPCRLHGTVQTMQKPETGKLLWWRIGDGREPAKIERDEPIERPAAVVDLSNVRASVFPALPEFRALLWEGNLLATGMEIRDGVAIFTPEHVAEIKRQVTWARPA